MKLARELAVFSIPKLGCAVSALKQVFFTNSTGAIARLNLSIAPYILKSGCLDPRRPEKLDKIISEEGSALIVFFS